MAKNELKTSFVFDDRDFKKIDALHRKLTDVNASFNNLGGSVKFGETVGKNAMIAGESVDKLTKKFDDFKTKADNLNFKPTISRHWENEASSVSKSADKIKLATDKLNNPTYTPGKPTGFNPAGADSTKPAFADKYGPAFSDIENRLGKVQTGFQKLAGKGQFDMISQGAFAAEKKVNDLTNRLRSLKAESADPSNIKYFEQYKNGIRDAEKELSRFEAKQRALTNVTGAGGRDAVGRPTGLQLSGFQKTNLSYQVNDIATMAAMGANPTQIIASQAGQIAQIFSPEQVAAFTAKYAALVPILGAGAAAIGLTWKITGDIREDAERRLKTEEKITATLNKQRLAAQELSNDFNKRQKEDAERRRIQYFQEDTPIDLIRTKRNSLEQGMGRLANNTTAEGVELLAAYRNEFELLDKQLKDFDRSREKIAKAAPDLAFDQRKLDFKNNQESERLSIEKRNAEMAERFRKSLEAGNEKVKELGKTYTETFENIFQKTNQLNPFSQVFSEADKTLQTLKNSIKGLPADLQNAAISLQNNLNSNALFSTRLDNALNAFDLRDSAAGFRNFKEKPFEIKDKDQFFKDYIDFYGKRIEEGLSKKLLENTFGSPVYVTDRSQFSQVSGGGSVRRENRPFTGYAQNATFGGTTQYDLRDGLNLAFDRVSGGGSIRRERSFSDLSEFEKQKYLSTVNQVDDTKNLSLQNRLDKQFSIINSLGAANPEQIALANRKIISLTQGVDPSQLTSSQREQAALAREREAVRVENAEREAKADRAAQLAVSKSIDVHLAAIRKIAEKDGIEGVNKAIEITVKDETNSGVKVLGATPTQKDMIGYYNTGGLSNY